jgi:hypothetical protein
MTIFGKGKKVMFAIFLINLATSDGEKSSFMPQGKCEMKIFANFHF